MMTRFLTLGLFKLSVAPCPACPVMGISLRRRGISVLNCIVDTNDLLRNHIGINGARLRVPATLLTQRSQYISMGGAFLQTEQQVFNRGIDVAALAARLDREDILLLREFYVTGQPYPDDTTCDVLRLLVDRLHRGQGPLAVLSYGSIRRRLENLVHLGLLVRIPKTNPAVYEPLDGATGPVRKIIMLFAADFVGLWKGEESGGL
jgi:hypothetical protein